MAFMVGQAIEQARASDRVACSYRIQLDTNTGRIFREGNGYAEYLEQTRALAANNDFVLKTDITDFYNQIYLHRLQNAISSADQNLYELATDIERFLTKLNDTVSHGVPVGPSASIVMAEAVLIDVDEFISGQGFQHIRYVDDFRIFGASMSDLNRLQQDLTLYLHNNHRLVLASGKTEIMSSADFLGTVVDDPHEVERREIHAALGVIQAVNGYEFEDDQPEGLPVDVQRRAELLKVLMQRVIDIEPLDLALARRVFRQSRRYVIRAIVPQLLEHFHKFGPVMNDVVLYLAEVLRPSVVDRYEESIERVLSTTETLNSHWIRYWAAELILRSSSLLTRERFQRWLTQNADLEHQAHNALLRRNIAWVREHRARLDQVGRWQRRQIMRSGLALALDERRHWYRSLERNNRAVIEGFLIRWLASVQ
jgi:hypothetical protein